MEKIYNVNIKNETTVYAIKEAIAMYKHWLSEANLSVDETEQTEGYYEALEEFENQLNKKS